MQEITQNPIIPEPSSIPWIASLVTLGVIILSIIGLFVYQFVTVSTIETTNEDIARLNTAITSASMDRDIIIADILSSTQIRPSMDLKALVRSFRSAATQAGVRLQGFSVKDDILGSTLTATRDSEGVDPVETIISMMRNQKQNTEISLVPIHSLQGSVDERTTVVSFHILPTNQITNATK